MDLKTALPIVLAILVMASFFLTWLSTKTWRAVHVTFVMLVFLSAFAFLYLAATVGKLHRDYGQQVNQLEAQLTLASKVAQALDQGSEDEEALRELERQQIRLLSGGIRGLQGELDRLKLHRGRVWVDIEAGAPAEDGSLSLLVEEPSPHGIDQGMLLFVFQQGNVRDGAAYLGEFEVTKVGGEDEPGEIHLRPTMEMTERQRQQLRGADGNWTLYELMPLDRTDLLADLSDQQLEDLFPRQSVEEYKKDGKASEPDDPEDRIQNYGNESRYARALRDYEKIFRELYRQRYVDLNTMQQRQHDQSLLEDAIASAKKDIAYRTKEIERLTADKAGMERDRVAVKSHLDRLTQVHDNLQGRLNATFQQTHQLAAELAEIQARLTREIDGRITDSTARAGGGQSAAALSAP